jgi:hypothetical protein
MKDNEIKKIIKSNTLKSPDYEWSRISRRIRSEHKALKISLYGVFATLLIVVTINVFNQKEVSNIEIINYMFEDGYLSGETTYDYVDL